MEALKVMVVIVFIAGSCKIQIVFLSITKSIKEKRGNKILMAQYLILGKTLKCYKCVSLSESCVTDQNVKGTEVECGNATIQTCMKIQGSKLDHSIVWLLVVFG